MAKGSLDSRIYGIDDNAYASGIASDALNTSNETDSIKISQSALSRGVDDKGWNPDVEVLKGKDTGGTKESKGN